MIRLGVLAGVSVLATIIGLVCFATDVIVGCNPANTAAIVDAGVCVTEGALAGLSVADIAKKCAIDVGTVLTTLNKSERKDVQSSPAYGEMKRAMVSLGRDAG